MTDREKVVKGLECCSIKQNCMDCPWAGIGCNDRLHMAVLELLKEQEARIIELEHNLTIAKENMSYLIRTGMLKEVKQNV